jgi:hypothetical protein
VFTLQSPKATARSLKRSAERSQRRKSAPYRSAMSMLTFYLNRVGRDLPASRRRVLNQAKDQLRQLFDDQPNSSRTARRTRKKKQAS